MPYTGPVNPGEPEPSPEPTPTPEPQEPPKPPGPNLKDTVAVAVACAALTGFGVFIIALLYLLELPENQWSRALFLLNGVEAVAFAAAGYLFGREVNRGRAENAEELADSEAQRAEQIEKNGQALAEAVRTVAGPPSSYDYNAIAPSPPGPDSRLESLARVANVLFPPRGSEAPR